MRVARAGQSGVRVLCGVERQGGEIVRYSKMEIRPPALAENLCESFPYVFDLSLEGQVVLIGFSLLDGQKVTPHPTQP